jgi:hypothetical protein
VDSVIQRRTTVVLVALLSSLGLVACGGGSGGSGATASGTIGNGTNNSSQPALAELTSAIGALTNVGAVTATIKTTATASQISSFASAHGRTLSSSEATALAGADISIEVAAPSAKKLSDVGTNSGPAAFSLSVGSGGTTYLSLRSLSNTIYVQADLKDLLTTLGDGSTFTTIQGESAALPSFVQALLADKWVSLPSSTLKSLGGALGGSSSSTPSPNPSNEAAVIGALKSLLTTDVTATRASAGKTDVLDLSANLKTLATGLSGAVSSVVPSAGGVVSGSTASSLPDQKIALTASVTGGALSELSANLAQFDHSSGQPSIPVNVFFTGGAAIAVPSGAVAVDSSQLSELFSGLAGGLGN